MGRGCSELELGVGLCRQPCPGITCGPPTSAPPAAPYPDSAVAAHPPHQPPHSGSSTYGTEKRGGRVGRSKELRNLGEDTRERRLGSLGAEWREPRNPQDLRRKGWDPRGLEEGDAGTLGSWQGKR